MKKFLAVVLSLLMFVCPMYVSAEAVQNDKEIAVFAAVDRILPQRPPKNPRLRSAITDYHDLTSEQKEQIYQRVLEGVYDTENAESQRVDMGDGTVELCLLTREIDFIGIKGTDYKTSYEDIEYIFQEVINYYPELFLIDISGFIPLDMGDGSFGFRLIYSMLPDEYEKALVQYNNKIDYIISGIGQDWSDLEKIVYVHNYLVINAEYDYTYEIHDAYQILIKGKGVCQSYTLAFTAIMHKLGIRCTSVLDASDEHTWNIVEVDGKFYHLDLTHDDSTSGDNGNVDYTHFLLSSEEMRDRFSNLEEETDQDGNVIISRVGTHREWYTIMPHLTCDDRAYLDINAVNSFACTDKTYETGHAWNNSDTAIVNANGEWYYIAPTNINNWELGLFKTDKTFTSSEISLNSSGEDNIFTGIIVNYGTEDGVILDSTYFGSLAAVGSDLYYIGYNGESFVICYNTLSGNISYLGNPTGDSYISSLKYDAVDAKKSGNPNLDSLKKLILSVCNKDYINASVTVDLFIFKKGDTNNDNKVDSADVVNAQKLLLGEKSNINWATLDLGGDIGVDLTDFIKLKKLVSN